MTPFLKCPPKKTSLKTGSTKTTNFQPLLKKTLMCSNSHHSLTISNPPLCQKRGYVFISTSEKRKETFIYNINHLCGFPINLSINQSINHSFNQIKSNQNQIKIHPQPNTHDDEAYELQHPRSSMKIVYRNIATILGHGVGRKVI